MVIVNIFRIPFANCGKRKLAKSKTNSIENKGLERVEKPFEEESWLRHRNTKPKKPT